VPGESPQAIKNPALGWVLEFGSATWTRTRDPMINSHLLYRLSYRGTTARMLLIKKEKSILCRDIYVVGIRGVQQWRRRRGFSRDSSGGSRLKPLLQGLAVYTKNAGL